jgi:hypothetical protein
MNYRFQETEAKREQIPMKVGISGVSGSGKTYTSLLLARGMVSSWDKIGVIDTENNSASLYSDLPSRVSPDGTVFRTFKGGFQPPYEPEKFIAAMDFWVKSGVEVIIIDSASKEWEGAGGILELKEKVYRGNFMGWGQLTPRHNSFIEAIVSCPVHVIVTLRCKSDYAVEQEQGKRATVQKLGTRVIQREGFEYELTLFFSIEKTHHIRCEKDRTGLFMGRPPFMVSPEHGKELIEWANSGSPLPEIVFYTGSGEEKQLLFKAMKQCGVSSDVDLMKEIETHILKSRIPMKEFSDAAVRNIQEYMEVKKAANAD